MTSTDHSQDDRPTGENVLLIGGKPDDSVRALAHHGARITCVATPKHALGLAGSGLVDRVVPVGDPARVEEVLLGLARHGVRPSAFDAVTSGLEYGLFAAAVIAELAGARGIPVETAVRLRDKHVQKSVLAQAGVPVARSAAFTQPGELVAAVAEVGGVPVVVKPPDGAGARATTVLRTESEVASWSAANGPGPWLCEEFVPGAELHIDGVVRDGSVTRLCVSRYFANMVDVHDGALNGSVTLREDTDGPVFGTARQLVSEAAAALGHGCGVFHLEAFAQQDGGLVFSECAGRVAGARIDQAVLMATGVNLHTEWAAAAVGRPSPQPAPVGSQAHYGYLHLYAPLGRIVSLPTVEDIKKRPGVHDAELKLSAGAVMPAVRDTNGRAGRAVLCGDSPAQVERRAGELDRWFRSATEVMVEP